MKLNRKEIVQQLKEQNLLNVVKIKFGDNYTRISTDKLNSVLTEHNKKVGVSTPERKVEDTNPSEISDMGLRRAFVELLTTLQMSEVLYPDEISSILNKL